MKNEKKPEEYTIDGIRIVVSNPPVYDAIIKAGMKPSKNAFYTYGKAIYNPSGVEIPNYIIEHEKVHIRQQGNNFKSWWRRYLRDYTFRINQEAEAYAKQYDFMCKEYKDPNKRNIILIDLARILSSPTYGEMIKSSQSYSMIKGFTKTKK